MKINKHKYSKDPRCPKCQSGRLSVYGDYKEVNPLRVCLHVECEDCGFELEEFYTLSKERGSIEQPV